VFGWQYLQLELDTDLNEASWRDSLAASLKGDGEVRIEGGRIDVLTDEWAVEVDRLHRWHEGLGQALHYSDASGREGVLALMMDVQHPDDLHVKTLRTLELVDRQCTRLEVRLVVLFSGAERSTRVPVDYLPVAETPRQPVYWLNLVSGVRHNGSCRYFEKTGHGRTCSHGEGSACSSCGG
jgi:hypothetical protein